MHETYWHPDMSMKEFECHRSFKIWLKCLRVTIWVMVNQTWVNCPQHGHLISKPKPILTGMAWRVMLSSILCSSQIAPRQGACIERHMPDLLWWSPEKLTKIAHHLYRVLYSAGL